MKIAKKKSEWNIVKSYTKDMKDCKGIYSIEEFHEVIKYERTRSDRNNSIFTIALFKSSEIYNSKKHLSHFIKVIKNQVRMIDHIGWHDEEHISVLLPDTNRHGAVTFCNKILTIMEYIENRESVFEVYTYPDNWLNKHDRSVSTISADNRKKLELDFNACVESDFTISMPRWKRTLDLSLSLTGLILTSPIFILLPVYLKIVSPGPVFFHQSRVGYKRQEFKFWKFRTMHHGSSSTEHGMYLHNTIKNGDTPMVKLDSKDKRIIPGGRIIRKACIDELPQLFNVLKGEMSLVGPRPCIPYEAEEYLRWHTHRFDVVPGLTGLWQVSGKNKLSFKQMIRLDIIYSKNICFWNDIRIILKTPYAIFEMILEAILDRIGKNSSDILSDPITAVYNAKKS